MTTSWQYHTTLSASSRDGLGQYILRLLKAVENKRVKGGLTATQHEQLKQLPFGVIIVGWVAILHQLMQAVGSPYFVGKHLIYAKSGSTQPPGLPRSSIQWLSNSLKCVLCLGSHLPRDSRIIEWISQGCLDEIQAALAGYCLARSKNGSVNLWR